MKLTLPTLASLVLLAGCVASPPPFPTAPPLPAEIIPLPPVSGTPVVWQPGDWVYTGGSYRFDAGHYVPAAGRSQEWMFGRWAPSPAGPVWVPGHFV